MANWTTLAAACLANRNYAGCLQAIDTMMKFNEEESSKVRMKKYEANEVIFMGVRALFT